MSSFIPVNLPRIDERDEVRLVECIRTGWISSEGSFVREFEAKMAERAGRKHGIAVTNGSAALDAAVAALRIGAGDEVILPSFTIISCAAAIVRQGAMPVPVDCDPETWTMDPAAVEAAITPATRAIMAVHLYGLPADMAAIVDIAERHGIPIIEDAAEAHGSMCDARPCGSFGALSTFSFYANKHVTSGEGGMIVTDDDALAERCRSLRNLCFTAERRFVHEEIGWNLRMTNLQAALGLSQLERLDEAIAFKRAMGRRYREGLSAVRGISMAPASIARGQNDYWVFGIVLDDDHPLSAADVMAALGKRAIGTRPFFWPMHQQPVFTKRGWYNGLSLPVSERLATQGLYLPSGLGLLETDQARVIAAVQEVLA
ncbi:MAG: perosamine synthetase [Bradymonadia bacterium]|jgi:perosamine synthetase